MEDKPNKIKDTTESIVIGKKVKEYRARFQAHLREHRKEYQAGAGGVLLGAVTIGLLKQRPVQIINEPRIAPVFNNTFGGPSPL